MLVLPMTPLPFPPVYPALLLSFVSTFVVLIVMLKRGWAGFAIDHPNSRSLHEAPIPRTGGLALVVGGVVGAGVLQSQFWPALSIAGGLLIVSLWDDVRGLSVVWRFLMHFLAAWVFVAIYGLHDLGFVGAIMAVLAIVWMTNLYNFMDGSDGLAGGMALFGFGFYGLAAWLQGDVAFAGQCWSVAVASLAFLFFNFHPARIFMGDAGSIPLGFLAAAFGLMGWRAGSWPVWFPVLVFSPFILDASVTLAKRLLSGEKVWQAHREHYYQRLVQMGWGHRRTAQVEYVLMVLAGASAVWANGQDDSTQWAISIFWVLVYLLAMWLVDTKWSRMQGQSRC
ncbi:glycosyl transferase family protein [Sulfuricella denitrificans skB26]|uniref:Glycosyl transferase family protein n=2 Tax=Sulfuricella denitrificans TaxID=649841 RepID=S6ADR0_SULDS|nr:glycosyl transferase family protein [Sulfuricella denitrificans skB26]